MHSYRCYVLDGRNRVAAIKMIECASDGEARQRADALLVQMPRFHGVEVWERERRVHINLVGVAAADEGFAGSRSPRRTWPEKARNP
jgi:hypothetical protein